MNASTFVNKKLIPARARIRRLIVGGSIGWMMALTSVAFAQGGLNEKTASVRNEEGKRSFKKQDYNAATRAFSEAYRLDSKPKYLWNLAVAELQSNRFLDALVHFKQYLKDPGRTQEDVEKAPALVAQARAQTGHLRVQAPNDIPVSVDGVTLSKEEREDLVDVAPGKRVVEAAYRSGTKRQDVDATAGKEVTVTFEPEETARPQPPSAEVVPPPDATLRQQQPAPLERSSGIGAPPVGTWILGGVAVAALGTGIAFSMVAHSKKDESSANPTACANTTSSECAHFRDLDDAVSWNATISWIAYVGSGAALVAGGLVWVLSSKTKTAPGRSNIVPLVAPGVAGIRLQTSF